MSEAGEVAEKHGVTILGHVNVPSRLAENASSMYARNLLNFLTPLVDRENGTLAIDWEDEIVSACLIAREGEIVHPSLVPPNADKDVA